MQKWGISTSIVKKEESKIDTEWNMGANTDTETT